MEKAKNVHEFIEKQRQAIAMNPECGTSHYNLAVGYMGLEKFDLAEEELHAALDCSPTLAEAYVQLGGLALRKGDMESCLYYNRMATKSRPAFAEGFGNIGFVLLQQGKIDEAIKNLEKAIVYNKKFIQAYTTLGNAYLMNGMVDKSIEANLNALDLEPEFAVAHNNLAIGYMEKGEYEIAMKHLTKAKDLGYGIANEIEEEIKKHLQ